MLNKKTIIVEDVLKDAFAFLPVQTKNAVDYKPVFKVGDENDLVAFFKASKGKTNYPLVWLQMPFVEEHKNRNKLEVKLDFILAVETNATILHDARMEVTFKPILYKLLDNIIDIFELANTIKYNREFKMIKYSNFSNENNPEDGVFIAVWDAIKLTVTLSINDSCLREIKL